jgi:integrase
MAVGTRAVWRIVSGCRPTRRARERVRPLHPPAPCQRARRGAWILPGVVGVGATPRLPAQHFVRAVTATRAPGPVPLRRCVRSSRRRRRNRAAEPAAQKQIIVPFLRWTGLRVSEAAAILDEDVDLSQLEIRVRVSKTARGIRTIPLLPVREEPVRAWRTYCQRYVLHQPGATFLVTRRGTPMQSRHISWTVRTVAARANVTAIGGHTVTPPLRRMYATDLLNRGVRLEFVSRLLGHSTTGVTEKFYTHLSDARLHAELEAAFISSPSAGVQQEASEARSLDRAELAAQLRELAQTVES